MSKSKVIFTQDSLWGQRREIKELARGFVLNYLLPKDLVIFFNKKNFNLLSNKLEYEKQIELSNRDRVNELYQQLQNLSLVFLLNKDKKKFSYGSVGFKDILKQLAEKGIVINKTQLFDFRPLSKVGESIIKIKLDSQTFAHLRVVVE